MEDLLNSPVKNSKYADGEIPKISVITPVYNRKIELCRCMDSIKKQTYRDFEYIIINDGSTENLDDVVVEFMDSVDFPVMYVKKANGGVHTARNLGVQYARGKWTAFLDSDDEFLPNALEIFFKTAESLPNNKWVEVKGLCVDQNGSRVGGLFPSDINDYPMPIRCKTERECRGEHIGFRRTAILKENPWPEPEGITFVTEGVIWEKLHNLYETYYINDMVRVYHTDTEVSYTHAGKKRSLQQVKNNAWNVCYMLNHKEIFNYGKKWFFKNCLQYSIYKRIIQFSKEKIPIKMNNIRGGYYQCFFIFLPTHLLLYSTY